MISGRLCRANAIPGPAPGHAVPRPDVDATVAIADQRRQAVLERLVGSAVDRGAVVAVDVREARVEGCKQAPALAVWDGHGPAHRRVGWFVTAGIQRERCPSVVKPRDVGKDARIVGLGAKSRDEHWRSSTDQRARWVPDSFAPQRMSEDRFDPRRPGSRSGGTRTRSHCRQRLQLGSAFLWSVPAVVDLLRFVDKPVAVMGPKPFDAPDAERKTRRLQHRRGVRVQDGREQADYGQQHDPATEPATTTAFRLASRLPPRRDSGDVCHDLRRPIRLRGRNRRRPLANLPPTAVELDHEPDCRH